MTDRAWPKAPVLYQIYPRSFRDTTGNGVGDLAGIIHGLNHAAELGVDAIWISPFYPSPWADGGYDITDHMEIDPLLGTLEQFDRLVARAHDLGLRVVIDQVFNHTSVEAPWFKRSVAGDPRYSDYYVWSDPKPDGTQPNNWLSQFGPPAWTWNHLRRQYYFHNFTSQQPSLNLRNEAVQDELCQIMRFWRDRGVDGFRIDAVTSLLFDPSLKDNPPATPEVQDKVAGENFVPYTYQDHSYDILPGDGLEFVAKLRDWAGEDAFLIGEVTSGNQSVELVNKLCCAKGLDAAYTTDLAERGACPETFRDVLDRLETPGGFAWWLSSHDQPRAATAHGDGSARDARFLLATCALMPGPWMIFQGEELGLPQPFLDWSENDDPFDRLYWPDTPGRAAARVPIPWSEGYVGFGFTQGKPWLTMRWDGCSSVLAQSEDEGSVLAYARRLIALRRASDLGGCRVTGWDGTEQVLRVETEGDGGSFVALLNFGQSSAPVPDALRDVPVLHSSSAMEDGLPARTAALWRLPS